ncbi:DUF4259 domain-containing protein [Streptomyces prasinus]|uniref:DUF4259 domain-containing protein n=1 Tax=Streptomyces prasinus TaxID=67345 RepID=UPI0012FEF2FC
MDGGDGVEAVAAAAFVASTIAASQIVTGPEEGSKESLPELPTSLHAMARQALHRVLQDGSELTTGWMRRRRRSRRHAQSADGPSRRRSSRPSRRPPSWSGSR